MVANKVFKMVLRKDLPAGTKIIDSVREMKKKSNGILCGQINARGFKQVKGQHYNNKTINSPVTNSATIRILLTLMIIASMLAHVVDVKGAFLHGEFEDREIIHMKTPQGFEKHFPEESVLLLLKCLYKLKQAAKAFLETAVTRCKCHGTQTKHGGSLPLRERTARHNDVMD